mgnify:CR=1 FL=1
MLRDLIVGPHQISFDITNKCNLRCLHCYNSSGENLASQNELTDQEVLDFIDEFNTIMSDADIARDLFASDNGSLLFNRLQKALQETLLKELVNRDIKMNVPSEQYPLISSFVAGGMVSAYYEWITDPDGITLDEMARTLTTLIISGVHAFA